MDNSKTINVLVYGLPNTNSGGLSVVSNLYEDIKTHYNTFPDIHWYFIIGVDGFDDTESITVINDRWALKSYLHRLYYSRVIIRKIVKTYDIKAVISLNMGIRGIDIPSIISFHNVLPFYHCGNEVFDSKIDMIKQFFRNRLIVDSLKRAECIIVPSRWIEQKLINEFDISQEKVRVSPISTPEVESLINQNDTANEGRSDKEFLYPASGFPYKNHIVIVEAVKKLIDKGYSEFYVRFIGNVGSGKTIERLKKYIENNQLPIEFTGLISSKELMHSYKTGTLVFPSKIETDGFPLLESMACGGYIIASDLDYAREALDDYDNYDLFNPDDAHQLAELMEKVILGEVKNTISYREKKKDIPRTSVLVPVIRALSSER